MGAERSGINVWARCVVRSCTNRSVRKIFTNIFVRRESFRKTFVTKPHGCAKKNVQEQKRDKKSEKSKKSKSTAKTLKKEKKAKSKKQASEKSGRTETPMNEGETLDLKTVLTQMAKEHNVPANE